MTSGRRRQGRPIESVELKVTFRGDKETNLRIRDLVPSAVIRGGLCEVRVEGKEPGEVAEKAQALLEKIRTIN